MNLMDKDKLDQVCIVKRIGKSTYKYTVIRGQRKHVTKVVKENDINKSDILRQLYNYVIISIKTRTEKIRNRQKRS